MQKQQKINKAKRWRLAATGERPQNFQRTHKQNGENFQFAQSSIEMVAIRQPCAQKAECRIKHNKT